MSSVVFCLRSTHHRMLLCRPLLRRACSSRGLKTGIIGLPNVGKSSLFNALTCNTVKAENFPFCTIEPNVGIVPVPDPRLSELRALYDSD